MAVNDYALQKLDAAQKTKHSRLFAVLIPWKSHKKFIN